MATTGYIWPTPSALMPFAEPARGPTYQALRGLAEKHRAWIVCGYAEQSGNALYNAALLIDPFGDLRRSYRKVLLYSADLTWARPGNRRMVLQTDLGNLAPAICMDLNDDGLIRYLYTADVDVLAFCTNWVEQGSDVHPYWRWRLGGWPGWVVAANSWGEDEGTEFSGRSAILAPGGGVVSAAASVGDDVILVDTDEVDLAKHQPPADGWIW